MKEVALIILKKENKFLLHLRDNITTISYPDYWSPIGGQIEKDETPLTALKREIKEEISCKVYDIFFIDTVIHPKSLLCYKHIMHIFKGRVEEELKNIVLYEGKELEYFSFEEFIHLKFPEPLKRFIIANKVKFL